MASEPSNSRTSDGWPIPGWSKPYDLQSLDPASRPVKGVEAIEKFTGKGYRARRNHEVDERPDIPARWWCRACNRCLRHSRSAFCDEHRPIYLKARRRARDQPKTRPKVTRDQLNRLRQLANNLLITKADIQGLGRRAKDDPEASEALIRARAALNQTIDALAVFVERELPR